VIHLGMFAKYWEAGSVKTRLAAAIGDAAASRIYFHGLSSMLDRFASLAEIRTLVYWPSAHLDEFTKLAGPAWQLVPQTTGDLGNRIKNYFEAAFQNGASRVVLIGSDSPTVPRDWIRQSWQMLEQSNVVLGPSSDGGYYLVGMSQFAPAIFDNIRWSSAFVLTDTQSRIAEQGLSVAQLPAWYDIDIVDDLHRLRRELATQPPADTDWTNLIAAIDDVI